MLAENAIWLIYLAVGYAYYRNAFDSLRRRERGDRAIGKTDPPKPDTRPPPHPIFAWLTSEKSGYREPN